MPEGLEVEIYRRAAVALVGRRISRLTVDDRIVEADVADALPGCSFQAARRIGKLLLLDTDGPTVGLHFGMTGRIVVDGDAPIEELVYGSHRDDPAWDRFVVDLVDGGRARVNDPRRWASVTLDPDTSALGPDLLALTADDVRAAVAGRRAPVKAVLLDQRRIAGLGNLCVDEVLFDAGIDPRRPGGELDDEDVVALHRSMATCLPAMLARGGSHCGSVSPDVRAELPPCPRDGANLRRAVVGGRSTVWCPSHQR